MGIVLVHYNSFKPLQSSQTLVISISFVKPRNWFDYTINNEKYLQDGLLIQKKIKNSNHRLKTIKTITFT